MNSDIDNWSLFVLRVELALKLEEKFAIDFKDEELEKLNTIGEVIQRTTSKVSSIYDYEQIRQQVYEATVGVGEFSMDQLQPDTSLFEALCGRPQGY